MSDKAIIEAIDRCITELMAGHKRATHRHPRGVFIRADFDGQLQAECTLAAVAQVVTPLVMMVEQLRREVAELKGEA